MKTTDRTTGTKRKRRSHKEIKDLVIAAATEEFKSHGYTGVTTAAIARRANITKAQLLGYFDSKAELFNEAIFKPLFEHFCSLNTRSKPVTYEVEKVKDRVRFNFIEMQNFLEEHSEMLLSITTDKAFKEDSQLGIDQLSGLKDYYELSSRWMTSRLDSEPQVDPKLVVKAIFAIVLGCVIFKDWLLHEDPTTEDDFREAILNFVTNGLKVNSYPDLGS